MDSDEDLPPLLPLTNDEQIPVEDAGSDDDPIPALIPIVERLSILRSALIQSDDDMPALMSVSDSSDDGDVSSFHFSPEDEESDWEDEGDLGEEFDEDLPRHPPNPEFSPESHEQEEQEDEEDVATSYPDSVTRRMPPLGPIFDNSVWLPPHRRSRSRSIDLIPEGLLEAIALRVDSIPPHDPLAPSNSNLEGAKVLVNGLERVSGGLLERMVRVGGAPGAYEDLINEDNTAPGCAICWEALLDQNLSEAKPNDVPLFAPEKDEAVDIVCLPCAHVFHSSCLIPWFSLKTSCPTCRFNIDPNSLTSGSQSQNNRANSARSATMAILRDSVVGYSESEGDDFDNPLFQTAAWAPSQPFGIEINVPNDSTDRSYHRSWTRPDAPGKSLREIIEGKEREMGLRCLDASCIFAPTDEAPHVAAPSILRRITITVATETICKHVVHPACLVKSTRTAGWEPVAPSLADAHESDPSTVEVGCPSCFALGRVSRRDWEEGVIALAQDKL